MRQKRQTPAPNYRAGCCLGRPCARTARRGQIVGFTAGRTDPHALRAGARVADPVREGQLLHRRQAAVGRAAHRAAPVRKHKRQRAQRRRIVHRLDARVLAHSSTPAFMCARDYGLQGSLNPKTHRQHSQRRRVVPCFYARVLDQSSSLLTRHARAALCAAREMCAASQTGCSQHKSATACKLR